MNQMKAAVIGSPISQSLSPAIFTFLARHCENSNLEYTAQEVGADELAEFVQSVRRDPAFIGFNVTIPHKEGIIEFLDEVTPEANLVGAVNVVQKKGSRLIGHNTDVYGIQRTFENNRCVLKDQKIFVMGAGGAARAVAFALGLSEAAQVDFLNSNPVKAENLIRTMQNAFPKTRFQQAQVGHSHSVQAWINTTPLGMNKQTASREGESAESYFGKVFQSYRLSFSKTAVAFDLIYPKSHKGESTPFLLAAQDLGRKSPAGTVPRCLNGLEMLVEQALETWKIWLGRSGDLNPPEKYSPVFRPEGFKPSLMSFLKSRPVYLTGLMGAGKSTAGPILARKMGWDFIDIDHLIEKEMKMSIPEIFKVKGELGFRELEQSMVSKVAFTPKAVIALGGGAMAHATSRRIIQKTGQVVFLSASSEALVQRLNNSSQDLLAIRPLVAGLAPMEQQAKLDELLLERQRYYRLATLEVQTDTLTPEQVACQIAEAL